MTEKLKPCPMCGNVPTAPIFVVPEYGDSGLAVNCSNNSCGLMGPIRASGEVAVKAWNRRPGEDKFVAALKELVDASVEEFGPSRYSTAMNTARAALRGIGE